MGVIRFAMPVYLLVLDGERGQSSNEGIDPNEMMQEVQAWKTDIMDNYSGTSTPSDTPMMIFINKKDSKAATHAWSGQDNSDLSQ